MAAPVNGPADIMQDWGPHMSISSSASTEADREVANTLAVLILGGLLVTGTEDQVDDHARGHCW